MPSTATSILDGLSTSVAVKAPCRVATTTNITLSGLQTIDSVAVVADDRVLVKNQTTQSQNGIYVVSSGSWTRAKDFDGNRDVRKGTLVIVENSGTSVFYRVSASNPIVIDTTSITFEVVAGAITQSIVAAALNQQTDAEGAAGVTPTNFVVPSHEAVGFILAARYGFDEDASAATNLSALQSARLVATQLGGGIIRLQSGEFDLAAEWTIAFDDILVIGAGHNSTRLNFNPSGTAVCINFDGGGSSLERVGVKGLDFKSSNSNNKTAVRFEDCRDFVFEDILIANGEWAGSGSIGLHTLGRDTFTAHKFHMLCARPVVIDVNPNVSTLHCDHFHIFDYEIGSTLAAGTAIEIMDGVNLTNTTIDGYGAIVLGKYGIKWDDTTSGIDSYSVKISGVRTEQATDATGYSVYLASTAQDLKALTIDNCYFDAGRGGIYGRKWESASLRNSFFTGGAGVTNLDITFQSRTLLEIEATEIPALSTVTLTNAVQVWGAPQNTGVEIIPKTATYRFDEGALVSRRCRREDGVLHFSYKGTIGDDVQINLPITAAAGADVCHLRIALGSATGPVLEGGSLLWRPGTVAEAGTTTNVVTTNTDANLCVLDSGNALVVLNRLGGTMDIVLDAVWSD